MALSKKPYRGTRDFFPAQKRVQDYIFNKMSKCAERFGYEPYNGPMLEEVALYKAKSGEELINDQIYSFTDRGDRFVAIRPEMTPTLTRMVSQIHKEIPKPIRWYSIPNLFRYEKPQKGRLREHWQLNCDIFGAQNYAGELEILQLLVTLFEDFDANHHHFEILINDRHIVDIVFKNLMKLEDEKIYKLYKIVDRSKKVSTEALKEMVQDLQIGADNEEIFHRYLNLASFKDLDQFSKNFNLTDELKDFYEFFEKIEEMGLVQYVQYDPTIVRGLDYYTGLVYEVYDKSPENRRALCGGGSYANLLQIFNEKPMPGTGFGMGDVTFTDFLKTHDLIPDFSKREIDILVTFQTPNAEMVGQKLAQKFRKDGKRVVFNFELLKMKKVFSNAERMGAKEVVLIGDDELAKNQALIKNLESREQRTIGL